VTVGLIPSRSAVWGTLLIRREVVLDIPL